MSRKKHTYEDVLKIVQSIDYYLLSEPNEIVNKNGFVYTATKINVWCGRNNHEPKHVELSKVIKGRKCKQCKIDSTRLNYKDVKKYIESLQYELISQEYKTFHSLLKIKCDKGHIFDMRYSNIKQGNRCPKCSIEKRSKTRMYLYKDVKEYVELKGMELVSEEYLGVKEKLIYRCTKGHEWSSTFDSFKNSKGCPECHGNVKYEYQYVQQYIENKGYKLLSDEYKNCDTSIEIMCNKGHIFLMKFYNFKQKNHRCPICKLSKGENRIKEVLSNRDVEYIHQYKFNDCKFKNVLPFDFYIPNSQIAIEYDGRQHYSIIEYFGGLDGFINTKIRDCIKSNYCKNNNIKLIRIPYWDFDNIENILNKELNL